jgi:hypothetical protein
MENPRTNRNSFKKFFKKLDVLKQPLKLGHNIYFVDKKH